MTKRKRFGEILMEIGMLKEAQLSAALERQKGTGQRLGQVLEEMKVVSEKDIAAVLSRQFGFKIVRDFAKYSFPPEILGMVKNEEALKSLVFPLKKEDRILFLAMVNPLDMEIINTLSFRTGLRIVSCVTTPSDIHAAVSRHYLNEESQEKTREKTAGQDWWTILVVDDQEMVRAAITAALRKEGYNLIQAGNGAEGFKASLQSHPHLIITDTIMPRMDGNEMFRLLQSNAATRCVPVMALSSKAAPEEEAKLLDMGYFDFIAKPINPVRLLARVKRALRIVYGDGGGPPAC